jgi:hypothetical protein
MLSIQEIRAIQTIQEAETTLKTYSRADLDTIGSEFGFSKSLSKKRLIEKIISFTVQSRIESESIQSINLR